MCIRDRDITVKQISCGDNHCMALLSIGAIMEWGANENGQLGNRKRNFSENPIIISDFTKENVLKVRCGYNNSAVIAEYNEEREKAEAEKKAAKAAQLPQTKQVIVKLSLIHI
eukprot:TRINITY_DN25151_c0_g1_i1.p1 TRINITY_DN25151_c0_g1~~TRINITY_DN25151_c0_g1_i1.p1  ORF type:complete len:132 (+),score=40.60 TRINITY_DN25151_c0_g1_i1:60-398(+)